jgi:DNA repair photolyase
LSTGYRYALGLTSQFFYCGLPLRLDSYSACQYGCHYCFARARGGASRRGPLRSADTSALARRLKRATSGHPGSVTEEMLEQRQPIHLGGMTDPFPPLEREKQTTRQLLRVLKEFDYPTVISTKGTLVAQKPYLDLLRQSPFIVQVSISSLDDDLMGRIDSGAPLPSARLKTLALLREAGIPTICRIQPVVPTRECDVLPLIEACASAGVMHVAVEHLKLPIETRWAGTRAMSRVLGFDLLERFRNGGAARVGREWVLPIRERAARVMEWRDAAHACGLSFGAADNDLLLLSDGDCCCSGVDLLNPAFGAFSRFTYTEAARRGARDNHITFDALQSAWRPRRSIAEFVNSRSRLPRTVAGRGVDAYLERGWNGVANGASPSSLFGVVSAGLRDGGGHLVYELLPEVREVLLARRRSSGLAAEA